MGNYLVLINELDQESGLLKIFIQFYLYIIIQWVATLLEKFNVNFIILFEQFYAQLFYTASYINHPLKLEQI